MVRNSLLLIIKSNDIVFCSTSSGKDSDISEGFFDSKILQIFLELILWGNYSVLSQKNNCHYFFQKVITSYSVFSFESQDLLSEGGTRLLGELLNFCVLICLHIFSINRNST